MLIPHHTLLCLALIGRRPLLFLPQASLMKSECWTTGSRGSTPSSTIRWWRWDPPPPPHTHARTHSWRTAIRAAKVWLFLHNATVNFVCVRACVQSIVRVVFHDRRLQYTEHQQLEGWKWNRPGDRLLDLGNATRTRPLSSAFYLSLNDWFFFFQLLILLLCVFVCDRYPNVSRHRGAQDSHLPAQRRGVPVGHEEKNLCVCAGNTQTHKVI